MTQTPLADAPASPSPQGLGTNGASAIKKRREVAYTREVTDREAAKESVNSIDQRGELRHDHREVCRLIVGGMADRDALAKKADVEVHVVDLVLGSALCAGYMEEQLAALETLLSGGTSQQYQMNWMLDNMAAAE